jgi:tripartite-type tricarboxylate transporter receptor subunit TctC
MRRVVFALAAFCVVASLQGVSAEEAYPRRAIKLIVPFAAGGNTDVVGRLTASYMQKALNANVVVENRAGAGGINGTDAVAKAAPDGYTLCICGIGPITVSPATEKLPYDPLKDLAPISLINTNPLVLVVNPQVKASSAAELAALSKSAPDGLSYGWSPARSSSRSPTCRMRWASSPRVRCARSPSPRPSAARTCLTSRR